MKENHFFAAVLVHLAVLGAAQAAPSDAVVESTLISVGRIKVENGRMRPYTTAGHQRDGNTIRYGDEYVGEFGPDESIKKGPKVWRLTEIKRDPATNSIWAASTTYYDSGIRTHTYCHGKREIGVLGRGISCVTSSRYMCAAVRAHLAAVNKEVKEELGIPSRSKGEVSGLLELSRKCSSLGEILGKAASPGNLSDAFGYRYDEVVDQDVAAISNAIKKMPGSGRIAVDSFGLGSRLTGANSAGLGKQTDTVSQAAPSFENLALLVASCLTKEFVAAPRSDGKAGRSDATN